MNKVKIIIYQAIFGGYDPIPKLIDAVNIMHDGVLYSFNHQIITEKNSIDTDIFHNYSPTLKNRFYKFNAVDIFDEFDASVYLDGHVSFNDKKFYAYIIELIKTKKPFIVNKHRKGGVLFDELFRIINNGKVTIGELSTLKNLKINMQKESAECGFIFRNHLHKELIQQGKNWFIDFIVFPRDQLLLHKSFQNLDIKPSISDITFDNNIFELNSHKNNRFKIIQYRIKKAFKILFNGLLLD